MGLFRTLLSPLTGRGVFWPQDWPSLEAGTRSLTGASVSIDSAMSLPAYMAAVRAISEDIAKLPFKVYEALPDREANGQKLPGGKRVAPEHPVYRVLHDVANPEMTAFTWREVSIGHLLGWGNCYSEIVRDAQGDVRELWPLPPDRVDVKRENGKRFYRIRLARPVGADPYQDLEAKDVFHVPGLGFDGLKGYDPISLMSKSIGVALAAQEYAERFWANNARPGGALVVPADLELSDRAKGKLRSQWTAGHQGLGNAQRIALLEDGITFTEIGMPNEAAQFLETRKFQVIELARSMRMQPHKIMDLERATFSNIEHQALEYVQDTLGGWAGRLESQARKDLLEPPFYAELLFDALLRGDSLTRARVWQLYQMGGNVTPNYVNERENFPLRTDTGGDRYMRPLNVTTEGGEDGKFSIQSEVEPPPPPTLAEQIEAATALIRAGFEPDAALVAVGLPAIDHTGLVPITVKPIEALLPPEPQEVPA